MVLKPQLEKDFDEAVKLAQSLESAADVARLLEVPESQLLYILYKQPAGKKYRSFDIPKKGGGFRRIDAPIGSVALLQKKLFPLLVKLYSVKPSVHGFVSGKSILTNAQHHQKRKLLLNVDILDFYGSINFGRVRGLFLARPFVMGAPAAAVLAQLCCFENRLPQGGPCSNVISNFIASSLDKRLASLARKYGFRYSRYADDLSLSTSKRSFPKSIVVAGNQKDGGQVVRVGKELADAIEQNGFRINQKKVRLQFPGIRQEVTGLTVNEFPNVRRVYVRRLRAMIHSWRKFGLAKAEVEYLEKYSGSNCGEACGRGGGAYFRNVVYGHLAYLKMVRGEEDDVYRKLAVQVATIDPSTPESFRELKEVYQVYDVFISHASEDKESVAKPILEACKANGINAFLDSKYIKWGDSFTEKINHALGTAKIFLAVLSKNSIGKSWPAREVNAAIAREVAGKQRILPLLVGDPDMTEVSLLEDKLYVRWDGNARVLAEKLLEILGP